MDDFQKVTQVEKKLNESSGFDPINYIHILLSLMFLTWKIKWGRFKKKLNSNDKVILRLFGRLKGKEYVYINERTEPIKFYGGFNLFFIFWYHFLILSKQFFKKIFSSKIIEGPKKKSMIYIGIQFDLTIEFLYFHHKLFEKKIIKDRNHSRLSISDSVIVQQILKKIVPTKEEEKKPYRKNIFIFFLTIYIIWFYVLVFILPYYFFPDFSVVTKEPIIIEILMTQIPIIAFWVFIFLLLSKFEKLILFTERYYDKNLKSSELDVPSSFQMRYEFKIAAYNTPMYIYLFLFAFNMYGVILFFRCFIRFNFNFLKAWIALIDVYFYSNILVLWALNFGFWTVAIYIIAMVTFGQYHISKNFNFLFDIYQTPNLDSEFQKFVKSLCFYILTTSFLIFSSGLVWFLTIEPINPILLIVLIIIFLAIILLVLFFFIISMIGWKRRISEQKKDVLDRLIKRRDFLIDKLKEKKTIEEINRQIKDFNFPDITELKFLHEQLTDVRQFKEWPVSSKLILSVLISTVTFIPDIFSYIQTWLGI